MICQRIGFSPISTMGLGLNMLSSEIRVPNPPASITTFTSYRLIAFARNICGSPERTKGGRLPRRFAGIAIAIL
jgi:hypothetical protein